MKQDLQETIDLLIYEVLGKFDLEYFKRLAASDLRPTSKEDQEEFAWAAKTTGKTHPEIDYAAKMLPELSKNSSGAQEGSSRRVFALSGGKVLKASMNQRGDAQNKAEVDIFRANPDNSVTTKVFDADPNNKWIIAEIVKPLSPDEFERLLKFPIVAFVPIRDMLWKGGLEMVKRWILSLKRMVTDGEMFTTDPLGNQVKTRDLLAAALQVTKNPAAIGFMQNVINFSKKTGGHQREIIPDHFGRTVDGRIVIYDFGGTEEIIRDLY